MLWRNWGNLDAVHFFLVRRLDLHPLLLWIEAEKVVDLKRLEQLTSLRKLAVSQSHDVTELSFISTLTGLTSLPYGNAYPGSDKTVHIMSFDWVEPLVNLQYVSLPGTSLAGLDLSIFARLRKLKTLGIPIRARHRTQIFALAESSKPFRALVKTYAW